MEPAKMASELDSGFLDQLTESLLDASSGPPPAERGSFARAALQALRPRNVIEAMLAARAIAAHYAAMDGFRRAVQPDISNADVVRLRSNAIAAARSFDATLRVLEKRQSLPSVPDQVSDQLPGAPAEAQSPPATPAVAAPVQHTSAQHTLAEHDRVPHADQDAPVAARPRRVPEDRPAEREEMTTDKCRAAYTGHPEPRWPVTRDAREDAGRLVSTAA
jgi:hypothetical protein